MSSLGLSQKLPPLLSFSPPPPSYNFSFLLNTRIVEATSRRFFGVVKVSSRTISTMETDKENIGSLKQQLARVFEDSLRAAFPDVLDVQPLVAICNDPRHGDYQCNNAMGLWNRIKGKGTQFRGPQPVGQAIIDNLPASEMIESCSIAGPGFINVVLARQWIAKSVQKMLIEGIGTLAPKLPVKRTVVDFSSPNIAKEMHVGHLRSTIIGDTLARMLEFSNVDVLRRNHVGDWGTQFGMLIEYLFEKFPSWEAGSAPAIGDLEAFYKASKQRFDSDNEFKERAQKAVVCLQGGEEKYRNAWAQICEISRREFQKVYERLGVHLEEKGESFYNPYIPRALELLDEKGLIEESEGARVIFIEGKKIPLIVVKRDGGYNYASTDLAALWYRLNEEKADWMIYLTDAGQREHFEMFFSAARRAGWLPPNENDYPKASHVGFGLVLGVDGKRFRTRSTEVVKLVDLLDEAKSRCKLALEERGKAKEWTVEELDQTAEAVGYGAVKYADLKNNRSTNYTFNFDQMLSDKGNTAVYLLYAHARICSIIRKSGRDIEELKKSGAIDLAHPDERALGLHLLQFAEIVEEACTNLLPNLLCEYLYKLSEDFTKFYTNCQFLVASWLFAPFVFNPSGFDWQKTVDDWTDWKRWMGNRGGIGISTDKSWESWWSGEQEHLRDTNIRGRVLEIILAFRFFVYQYGIVYHLDIAHGSRSILVYGLSWFVMLTALLVLKMVSMGRRRFGTDFQPMFRILKALLFLGFVSIMTVLFVIYLLPFLPLYRQDGGSYLQEVVVEGSSQRNCSSTHTGKAHVHFVFAGLSI